MVSTHLYITFLLIGVFIFHLQVKYTKIYLRDTTLIPPFPMLLFGGDIDIQHRERLITLDGWIHFQVRGHSGSGVCSLWSLLYMKIRQKCLYSHTIYIFNRSILTVFLCEMLSSSNFQCGKMKPIHIERLLFPVEIYNKANSEDHRTLTSVVNESP